MVPVSLVAIGAGTAVRDQLLSCVYIMAFVPVRGYFMLYKRGLVQNGVCGEAVLVAG